MKIFHTIIYRCIQIKAQEVV